MDKLQQLIENLVAEKSLSFEVLEQLKKIKDQSDFLIKENQDQAEKIKRYQESITEKDSKILELSNKLGDWSHREGELIGREKAVLQLEHEKEISELKVTGAQATLSSVKEIVGLVFRNTSVKKSIYTHKPLIRDGYSTGNTATESATEEITEE